MGVSQFPLDLGFVSVDDGDLAAAEFQDELNAGHVGHLCGAAGGNTPLPEQPDGEGCAQICRELRFSPRAHESGRNLDDYGESRCHGERLAIAPPDTTVDSSFAARRNSRREKQSHVAPHWPGMEIMGMWL